MNLLSNLLEFSDHQATSMMFCLSPKEATQDKNAKQLKNLMSERKEECITPQRKVASKSLSKLDLLSLSSNAKIDPKQRLLHRMIHKLSMKCRKHYYNFFVVLENLKKNNQTLNVPKEIQVQNPNITTGLAKIIQVQQILFSKYFQLPLKKSALKSIMKWGKNKAALLKLIKILNKKYMDQSFKSINKFSKQKEKEEIRMDILLDSVAHIERSINNYYRIVYQQHFMGRLKLNLKMFKEQQKRQKQLMQKKKQSERLTLLASKPKKEDQFITPTKVAQAQSITTKPFNQRISPFSKEKVNLLPSNTRQIKKNKDESPGKLKQPIVVTCQQVKLKIEKCYNYIKNSKIKTNLNEQVLSNTFHREPQYQISKRCQPNSLQANQLPDLNDRSVIFFNEIFRSNKKSPLSSNFQISQSSVQIFNNTDSFKQVCLNQFQQAFEDEQKRSQASLISPLIQNCYEQPRIREQESRKSINSSGVKGSAFGSQAVSFKNSLVLQRQSIKNERLEQKGKQKKELNFAKIKNQVKNEKKAHDQFFRQSQLRFRGETRPQSANKDYNSLKQRRQSDFTISIPQGMISLSAHPSSRIAFTKRISDTPQPELIRNNYTSERKHLSLMNNNKIPNVQEQSKKAGATYLKILSKK